MANRVLSIEIGHALTKICEMDNKAKKPKVYKCLSVKTPKDQMVDGVLHPTEEFKEAILKILSENGVKTKRVIFTIASSKIASREVQIPAVKESRIESLIQTNATDYFPIDLQNYEVGYHSVGAQPENGKLRVMALAVPKTLLNSYYELAEMCGMEIVSFDYSSNSLYQILKNKSAEGVTMILKVDASNTIATIMHAGRVLMQRNVAYGVSDAIDTMIETGAYNVSNADEAIELLRRRTCINKTLNPGDKLWEEPTGRWVDEDAGNEVIQAAKQSITSSLGMLINGIARLVDYYTSRNSELPITQVYLTGFGGDFSGLSKLLTNCLERKVRVLRETNEVVLTKSLGNVSYGEYISCLGAVIKPVGLVDKEAQKAQGLTVVSGTNYTFVSVAVLAMGIFVGVVLCFTSITRYQKALAEQKSLNSRIQELAPVQVIYNEYLAAQGQYHKYQYFYEQTETYNENLVEFMNELEEILPSSFYTNSFTSDEVGINMSVTVEGKEAAARTIKNIRDMESIDNVDVSGINETVNELGESSVTFSITGTYIDLAEAEAEAETVAQ